MPTLYEQYEKYHYVMDKDTQEEVELAKKSDEEVEMDIKNIAEWLHEREGQTSAEHIPFDEWLNKRDGEEKKALSPEEEEERKKRDEKNRGRGEAALKKGSYRLVIDGNRRGYIDEGGNFAPFPSQNYTILPTVMMVNRELDGWGKTFPDDPDIGEKFPAVDPQGCYCEVDMELKDRIGKVKAAQVTRPEAVQNYVNQFLENMANEKTLTGNLWKGVTTVSHKIQVQERAAKRAYTQRDSYWFSGSAEAMKKQTWGEKGVTGKFSRLLNIVEYAAGLSDQVPSPEDRKMAEEFKIPLTPQIEAERTAPARVPDTIQVDFADFSSKMEQKYFCNPEYWGKKSRNVPKDAPSAEVAEASLGKYLDATVDRQITPLFAQAEKATNGKINRSELIIVGGKTVREHMEERYRKGIQNGTISGDMPQEKWCEQNMQRMTGEIVSVGLMAGQRVEAFVPDKSGRIPKEPVGITKTGYEPSPLEKVTLNAWERHFARHGYYKEKAAKAVDYQQTLEARERVQLQNSVRRISADSLSGNSMKDMFFGEWMKENNAPLPEQVPGNFSVTRSTFTSMAICAMVNKGYHMEEILDPGKLVEERNAIGKEVIDRMSKGDKEWEANTIFQGGLAMQKEIDRIGASFDYTNEKELFSEKGRPLFVANAALFDIRQEMGRGFIKESIQQAAEKANPGKGIAEVEKFNESGRGLDEYLKAARQGLESRAFFHEQPVANLANIAAWEHVRGLAEGRRSANPGIGITNQIKEAEISLVLPALMQNQSFQKFGNMVVQNPGIIGVIERQAVNGDLGRKMKVQYHGGLNADFKIDAKVNEKKEAKGQKLREVVSENLAKDARKQRDKEREAAAKKPTPKR